MARWQGQRVSDERTSRTRQLSTLVISSAAFAAGARTHLDFLRRHGTNVAQGTLTMHAGTHDFSAGDSLRRHGALG
jgi:hypothetical protein